MGHGRKITMLVAAMLAALFTMVALWSIAGAQPPTTQVCMAIDGSGSVAGSDFTLMLEGLASAVEDGTCLPQDGSVELTVVQFSSTAQVEVGPVTVTTANASTVAATIRSISQMAGTTNMAAAFTACEDAIVNSPNFSGATFQVINLSTDGVPDDQAATVTARDSAISAGIDEIDAEAIGTGPDVAWLRDSIVWPQPGHEVSVDGYIPGWVAAPADYQAFAAGLCTKFQMLVETEDVADLAVIKMSKPDDQVHAGEPFVYTIFVENLGPTTAFDVGLRDEIVLELGSTLEVLDVAPEDPVLDACEVVEADWGYTIECTKGEPLSVQGIELEGRWTVQVTLVANETQDVDDLVTVFSSTPDPDLSNNVTEDFISVTDVADLSIEKSVGCEGPEGGCIAGDSAYFGVGVYNDGPSTAENVVVEDLLPSGVTVVGVEGDGACTTGIPGAPFAPLTCNLGNIPAGENRSFDVQVRIDPDYPLAYDGLEWVGTAENDAWVYSDIFDPDNGDNRDHEMVNVYAYSALSGWKDCPETVLAGEELEYDVYVGNQGPSTVHNLTFADPLDPGVTFLDYEIVVGEGTCSYSAAEHALLCPLGDVDPGEERAILLTVRVDPDYDGGYVSNDISHSWWADTDFDFGESSLSCQTQVEFVADLSIQKSVEPLKVYPGYEQLYHVQVTNNGPMDAPDVTVTDTLPSGVHYEIDNDNCDLFSEDPDVLECHLGTIPAGQSVGFDISALVDVGMPAGEITNTVLVSMPYDINPDNNFAWATNLVLEPTVADLSLQKWPEEAPPEWFDGQSFGPEDCYLYNDGNLYGMRAGCPLRYQMTITNTGPLLAQNVVVEDALPAGVTVEGVGSSQGSCTTGIPGNPAAPLTCNLGNILRDEGASIEVFVRTDADLAWEQLENDAVVSSGVPDPDNGNNRSHVLIWMEPFSYLYLDKEGPSEITAGQEIEYWINIRNEGPSMAHEVHLDDQLPGGVSLVSADIMIGEGSCAPGSTLCSFGDMEPWTNRAVRIRGYVEPWLGAETVITNTAWTWAESPFNQPAPEQQISDTVETLVHSAADLSIRKTADPYKVYAGEQIRYDVSVTNNGPAVAYNVVVTDTLDPGVEYEIDTDSCQLIYSESITPTMLGCSQPSEGGYLFSTDLISGTGTYIGQMPEYLAPEIEYDNTSGRLFASMGFEPWYWNYGFGPPRLYELDPNSGASLGYVQLEEWCSLPGLEFVDGTLYGACSEYPGEGPDLYTIDPDTGDMGYVGYTYLDEMVHGLAYDQSSDTMYGLVVDDPNELVTIDLDDGEAHWLCDIWDADYGYDEDDLRAIEFGPDGTLYGGIAYDSDLVVIDPSPIDGYCLMTHVGDTGFSVSGLTLADTRIPLGVQCSLGDIQPGDTSNFSIWARVKPDTLGMINNRVDVISETPDPDPNNNWDTEANLVLGKADLKVTKYGKPDGEVRAGEELEYWVVVDNLGPGYAHEVVLYDLLSSDGEFDLWWGEEEKDGDGEEYSCRASGCDYCEDDWCEECYGDVRLTCRLNDPLPVMTPDASGRWLLKVWVRAYEEQSINNLARVIARDYDPDLSNNEARAEHDVTAVADLDLDKQAWGEVLVGCEGETELWANEVAAGGVLEYTLEIYNNGPSEAENVVVEDWGLSPFLDILDVECEKDDEEDECSCNTSGLGELGSPNRHMECYLGTIEEDDEDHIVITARIPSDVPEGTRLVNDARVYSDVFDDYNGDNLDSNWTTVSRWADLQVEKTQQPEISLPGQNITYSITVTNLGVSDAEGVFVSDTLPVQVLNPTWTCCASDGQCDCPCEVPVCPPGECPWPDADTGLFAQADIPAGEWVIYTVEGTLDWWPCGPFTNTVELIPPQSLVHPDVDIDPCDENNVAEAVNDPFCHFDPLVLKAYPGPDSPP